MHKKVLLKVSFVIAILVFVLTVFLKVSNDNDNDNDNNNNVPVSSGDEIADKKITIDSGSRYTFMSYDDGGVLVLDKDGEVKFFKLKDKFLLLCSKDRVENGDDVFDPSAFRVDYSRTSEDKIKDILSQGYGISDSTKERLLSEYRVSAPIRLGIEVGGSFVHTVTLYLKDLGVCYE